MAETFGQDNIFSFDKPFQAYLIMGSFLYIFIICINDMDVGKVTLGSFWEKNILLLFFLNVMATNMFKFSARGWQKRIDICGIIHVIWQK